MTTLPEDTGVKPESWHTPGAMLTYHSPEGLPPFILMLHDHEHPTPYYQFLGVSKAFWLNAATWPGVFTVDDIDSQLMQHAYQQINERAYFQQGETARKAEFDAGRDPNFLQLMEWPQGGFPPAPVEPEPEEPEEPVDPEPTDPEEPPVDEPPVEEPPVEEPPVPDPEDPVSEEEETELVPEGR